MKETDCLLYKCCGRYAHWLLRLSLASVFLYHGLPKFQDLAGFAGMIDIPVWAAALVALAEVGGSLALLVGGFWNGILTKIGGSVLVPVLIGAIWMVHWGQWGFMATESHPLGGMEFQVVLLALALFFAIMGNQAGGGCCGDYSKKK